MKLKKLLFSLALLMSISSKIWADTEPDNNTFAGADALAVDVEVEGDAGNTATDAADYYMFTTTENGSITATLELTGAGYFYLRIYDSDGTTQLVSELVLSAGTFSVTREGLAAGNYYVGILAYNASSISPYTLSVSVLSPPQANDTEPNGTYLTAGAMDENSSVEGNIGYRYNGGTYDVDDYYQFTTTNDGNITIAFTNSDVGHYNQIYLYDADGTTLLDSEAGYGSASFTREGLAAGTYYARINYYSSAMFAGYTLTNTVIVDGIVNDNEPNGTFGEALPMLENNSVEGHIGYRLNGGGYDQADFYEFTTTNDGNITLAFSSTEPGHYNTINLYDSDGITSLGSASGYGGASFTAEGLAAGTYYARMHYYAANHHSGYTLTNTVTTDGIVNDVEPNNLYTEALPMSENGSVNGHIGYRVNGGAYDISDYYQFTTTEDGNITIAFSSTELFHYNSIYLYDNNGTTLLGSQSGYGGASFTSEGLAAGTYYARIGYYAANHFSGYTLTNTVTPADYSNDAEPNNSTVEAVSILTNSTVEGHIGYRLNGGTYDVNDYYTFTTHSAGDIVVTYANPNGKYNTIQILGSDGVTVLAGGSDYGEIIISELNAPAGVYYIRVNYYSPTYFTGYTLTNNFCPDEIIIIAEGETTFCDGESVVLSTQDHHLSYLWNDGSVTESNTVTLSGDFYLTIDNGDGCVRVSNTINIESTPLPVAIIDADGPTEFCDGGSVTLSVPIVADTYLWSTGETTATITVSTTGDYDVVLTKNDCSAISDPIHIEVNENPIATISADGPTEFCEGAEVTLTATAASSYLWSNGETTNSILVNADGSFSVTITDANGCEGTSATTDVTVNANPTAEISADGPTEFCEDGDVTLTATDASSYLWSNGETTGSILVNTGGSYSVTITDANGCEGTSGSTEVTVNASPVADISADGPTAFCIGESVNLTASGGTDYLWSTGETSATINVTTTDDYFVTVFNAEGCSDVSSVISVTASDCGSLTIFADGVTEFCEGGSVTLTSSEVTGNIWSTGETTQSIVVTESGDYYAENGINTSNIITVTVNENPVATISPDGATTFCDGGSVTLNASSAEEYLWSNGETTSSIIVTTNGSYSVTITDVNGCMATSSNTDVTVNENPTPVITADGPTDICEGSVGLSVDGIYDEYLWSNGETTNSIVVSTTGVYTITVTENGCTGISNEINVTSDTAPTVTISSDGTLICFEANTMLTATTDAASIQWQLNGVDIPGATNPIYSASVNGKYRAVATNGLCSTISDEIKLKYAVRLPVSPGGTVSLCGLDVNMSVTELAGATYQWYQNNTLISGATESSYTTTTTGKFYCLVTQDGCTRASKLQTVNDDCRLEEGNTATLAVSPNPAVESFTILYSITQSGTTLISISDISGRIISYESKYLEIGNYTETFETSEFSAGMYIITLTQQDGLPKQQKLVIEK